MPMASQNTSHLGRMSRELIQSLRELQFCELRPSPIHGIGVFAIRTIPKGIDPLRNSLKGREIRVAKEQVAGLPPGLRRLLKSFCYYDATHIWIPSAGLNVVRLAIYLNHDKRPNLEMLEDGSFRTLRRIAREEELTMDYDSAFGDTHRF
ncbi:MAG: SET domain-containing protein [Betaproteobacteria bacterium]|jgi:SET domain-containing protein|nr:SET domain-containing protein [Betaproteobacteria bacterium]NBQ92004.1 SET domain-containing protein [Betaproteobacteria bacterium]NBT11496.1 SET domain-containing protein [Betaproteobacteria bacterium]NBU50129.1 SET domain-containing protein [Betaproteobacteria bacterium]NBX96250.1 SET domain-containing protein [Betaproteobacteria bacterium]